MKERIKTITIIVLALALLGLGGLWFLTESPDQQSWAQDLLVTLSLATPDPQVLTASGYIEATQFDIAPQVTGQIAAVPVVEGDPVRAGQVLLELDSARLDVEISAAAIALDQAETRLTRVQVGARPEEIAVAEANLALAEAAQQAAGQYEQDLRRQRASQQSRDLEIAGVRTEIAATQEQIARQADLRDAARLLRDLRERQVDVVEQEQHFSTTREVPGRGEVTISGSFEFPEGKKRQAWAAWNLQTTDYWQAWIALNRTVAAHESAQDNLDNLLTLRDNPQQLALQVRRAESDYQRALAGVAVAQANLDLTRAGATTEQLAQARAAVDEARAALEQLHVQRTHYTLTAPMTATVLQKAAYAGEMAQPGRTLLTLGNLETVELTVYVPEPDVDRVDLNQTVQVSVDTFPMEIFSGQVIWIADEAEYTPGNVQTAEERATTVFAVRIRLSNPDHKLKPGMPADATFVEDRS